MSVQSEAAGVKRSKNPIIIKYLHKFLTWRPHLVSKGSMVWIWWQTRFYKGLIIAADTPLALPKEPSHHLGFKCLQSKKLMKGKRTRRAPICSVLWPIFRR